MAVRAAAVGIVFVSEDQVVGGIEFVAAGRSGLRGADLSSCFALGSGGGRGSICFSVFEQVFSSLNTSEFKCDPRLLLGFNEIRISRRRPKSPALKSPT